MNNGSCPCNNLIVWDEGLFYCMEGSSPGKEKQHERKKDPLQNLS